MLVSRVMGLTKLSIHRVTEIAANLFIMENSFPPKISLIKSRVMVRWFVKELKRCHCNHKGAGLIWCHNNFDNAKVTGNSQCPYDMNISTFMISKSG